MRLNEDWQKFRRLLENDKFRFTEQALGRALWSPDSSAFKFPKTHKAFLCKMSMRTTEPCNQKSIILT